MEEKEKNNIDSYLLIKKISAALLAVTTMCGAFYIGYAQFLNPVASIFAGIFSGVVAVLSIDILLGAVMDDLFDPKQSNFGKWLLMFVLLCMSGGATGLFAYVIGEKMGEPLSIEKKQDIRASVSTGHSELVSANQYNATQLKKDIRAITYRFKKDTAAIIAQMPDNHQYLYRKGLHARYMNRSGYSTLKENVGRIENRVNQYESDLKAKQDALNTIESGLANMLSSDPLENINSELKAIDQRKKKEGDLLKGVGWVVDLGLALSLFFSFLFARIKIRKDPTIEIPRNEFHSWVLDRLKNLSKKLLESTEGADNDLQYVTGSFVKLFTSTMGLFGWCADMFSMLVSAPRNFSEKRGFTTFKAVTNDSSPAPTAPHRLIGFHRDSEHSEQRPVNSGELTKKLAGEQPVNSGEQKPVKPGGTEVLAGEQLPVHQRSEQPVETSENRPVNNGEQVVNVQVVNGEPTFHHYSERLGESRKYTRNEVSRFVSKYTGEIRDVEDWIKKNQNKAKVGKVLAKKEQLEKKERLLEYWSGGLAAIDRIKAKK